LGITSLAELEAAAKEDRIKKNGRMLRQRDLDRCIAEFQGFAALCDDDLFFRCAKLLGRLRRDWCTDNRRAGLPRNGANVRNMIRCASSGRFALPKTQASHRE
jgi:hypothetical protein